MARRLAGTVTIDGTDDEWFSDEHGHSTQTIEVILDEGQPANDIEIKPLRFGGEVRIELQLRGQVVGTGTVQLSGRAKLFEGTSEDTDDLDASQDFVFTVPKGGLPATY